MSRLHALRSTLSTAYATRVTSLKPHTSLSIMVVGFHDVRGPILEWCYPPEFADISSSPTNKDSKEMDSEAPQTPTTTPYYFTGWSHCRVDWVSAFQSSSRYIPFLALPDAAHRTESGYVHFLLPASETAPVYGVSCYRRVRADPVGKFSESGSQRQFIQKAVCLLSQAPFWGLLQFRLQPVTVAYFKQRDFSNRLILVQFFDHLNGFDSIKAQMALATSTGSSPDVPHPNQPRSVIDHLNSTVTEYVGGGVGFEKLHHAELLYDLEAHQDPLIMRLKPKPLLTVLKAIMLETRIVVYSMSAAKASSAVLTLLSYIPGALCCGFNSEGFSSHHFTWSKYGFPLELFHRGAMYPYVSLQLLDDIIHKKSFLVGTTNRVVPVVSEVKPDIVVHVDDGRVHIVNRSMSQYLQLTSYENRFIRKISKMLTPLAPTSGPSKMEELATKMSQRLEASHELFRNFFTSAGAATPTSNIADSPKVVATELAGDSRKGDSCERGGGGPHADELTPSKGLGRKSHGILTSSSSVPHRLKRRGRHSSKAKKSKRKQGKQRRNSTGSLCVESKGGKSTESSPSLPNTVESLISPPHRWRHIHRRHSSDSNIPHVPLIDLSDGAPTSWSEDDSDVSENGDKESKAVGLGTLSLPLAEVPAESPTSKGKAINGVPLKKSGKGGKTPSSSSLSALKQKVAHGMKRKSRGEWDGGGTEPLETDTPLSSLSYYRRRSSTKAALDVDGCVPWGSRSRKSSIEVDADVGPDSESETEPANQIVMESPDSSVTLDEVRKEFYQMWERMARLAAIAAGAQRSLRALALAAEGRSMAAKSNSYSSQAIVERDLRQDYGAEFLKKWTDTHNCTMWVRSHKLPVVCGTKAPPQQGFAKHQYDNGDEYTGCYLNGLRHGKGVYSSVDGFRYDGEWCQDQRHGQGTLFSEAPGQHYMYCGGWQWDKKHGEGQLFVNSEQYTGSFKHNFYEGQGAYLSKDGTQYEGEFKAGRFHGAGKLRRVFRSDVPSPLSARESVNPSQDSGCKSPKEVIEVSSGEWRKGKLWGMGNKWYHGGSVFSGMLSNGRPHGTGNMTYPDGTIYEGSWKGGKRHGHGIFTIPHSLYFSDTVDQSWAHPVQSEGGQRETSPNNSNEKGDDEGDSASEVTEPISPDQTTAHSVIHLPNLQGGETRSMDSVKLMHSMIEGSWGEDRPLLERSTSQESCDWSISFCTGEKYSGPLRIYSAEEVKSHLNQLRRESGDLEEVDLCEGEAGDALTLKGKKFIFPHGVGVSKSSSGETYSGEWSIGMRHGSGELIDSDGGRYSGVWLYGKRETALPSPMFRPSWPEISLQSFRDFPLSISEYFVTPPDLL
eukprot:GHVN01059331.1.p1 GENE.GHVN01059331.1~~GHVN01059331.1.p1  ORF type:complete len:1342 (+),score=180.28 GHVN01059331.1:981-5006(+)